MTYWDFHKWCAVVSVLLQALLVIRIRTSRGSKVISQFIERSNQVLHKKGLSLSWESNGISLKNSERAVTFRVLQKPGFQTCIASGFLLQSIILGPLQVILIAISHVAISGQIHIPNQSEIERKILLIIMKLESSNDDQMFVFNLEDFICDISGMSSRERLMSNNEAYYQFMEEHFGDKKYAEHLLA